MNNLILARRHLLRMGGAATLLAFQPELLKAATVTSNLDITILQSATGSYPGQSGNSVGYAAAPGYTGSLTPYSGSFTSGSTYNHLDFADINAQGMTGLSNITFNGCRFQSNSQQDTNTKLNTCSNITWNYCSFTPLVSSGYTSPPGAAWPSASAGQQQTNQISGVNSLPCANAYQFGLRFNSGGPYTVDRCDIWGFGNAIDFQSTTSQINIIDCWIHDGAFAGSPCSYHTDGPGYLDNGTGPNNVLISHCTIASIGNTNALAFQAATGGYNNITIQNNYLSGFNVNSDIFHFLDSETNIHFTGNVFGTDLPWSNSPLYADKTAAFSGSTNTWANNTLNVVAGTSSVGSGFTWTSGQNGYFFWPNISLHSTDWVHP